jgi:hypothetical protein
MVEWLRKNKKVKSYLYKPFFPNQHVLNGICSLVFNSFHAHESSEPNRVVVHKYAKWWQNHAKYVIFSTFCILSLSLGVKQPVPEADHSPPSSAKVKECTQLYPDSPACLHGMVLRLKRKSTGTTSPLPFILGTENSLVLFKYKKILVVHNLQF